MRPVVYVLEDTDSGNRAYVTFGDVDEKGGKKVESDMQGYAYHAGINLL